MSDFDLLVVLRDSRPEQKHAELLTLYRALESAGVAAEPWVMSEEEFEETKSVDRGPGPPGLERRSGPLRELLRRWTA